MAIANNYKEFKTLFMDKLDQHIIEKSTTGWMEANAGQVQYKGGDEVKVPTISTAGLATYDRVNGYTDGAVTFEYNTYKMTQDRGRSFSIDAMDSDQTGFVVNAAAVAKVFQENHVIPELDSYRYAKIAKYAGEAGVTEDLTPTASNIIKKLKEHIYAIKEKVGDEQLIITMPYTVQAILESSTEWTKIRNVGEMTQGGITFKVSMLDGHIIKGVPSARMNSEIEILDGKDKGQGGFKVGIDAKRINWIITPRRLPLAISKTDTPRIFDPMTNQSANAWKLDYRKFHDLWILKQQQDNMFVALEKGTVGE